MSIAYLRKNKDLSYQDLRYTCLQHTVIVNLMFRKYIIYENVHT